MTRFTFFIGLLAVLLVFGMPAQAVTVLDKSQAEAGAVHVFLPYFEDQTGSNSVVQAQVQLSRFIQSNQIRPEGFLSFPESGTYWINVPLTNNTDEQEWQIDFTPHPSGNISAIKSMSLYDPNEADTLAISTDRSLPLKIKTGETVSRFIQIETWPGIKTPVIPHVKTKAYVAAETITLAQKLGLLWLVAGAVCGAGLVQFLLARQSIQAVLALNAVLVGIGTFLLFQSDILPIISELHPVILPLLVNAALGIFASIMLWVATAQHPKAPLCLLPILLNLALPALAFFNIDTLINTGIGLEYIPHYLLTVTGLILLVATFVLCFATLSVVWFFPAWLALTAMPWLGASYPFIAAILYVLMLGVAGVASVFSHWRNMDNETASLQRRLRQELKASKEKYKEEHDNWDKKMENQRVLLNELRQREQQRSAELELAKKEADAANKAKSDFLAIISHEIRTPMNGIMGILQVIEQTPLDEKQFEYIEIIKNSGETMVTLLNDILDYSKIENGVIDLEIIPFSLRKLVNSVAMLMSGRSKDKGLNVSVDIHPALEDTFQGDAGRIRQILLNLVSNAIKFTEKGSVTIRVKPGSVNGVVLFEIIDTGMGISVENQEKLFQPYAQADASINRRFGGTGLGLNICRMLVEAMNGHLGLTSVENQGSTFWFDLPLATGNVTSIEPQKKAATDYVPAKKSYVLVIDDNEVNLKIASSLLEMDGHEVITALSGEQGLQMIDQDRFDVIFVDMLMPNMNGKTFVEKLRQNPLPVRANVPVFALTGLAGEDNIDEILAVGNIMDVIVKPITQAALRQAMDRLTQPTANAAEKQSEPVTVIVDTDPSVLNLVNLEELKQSLPRDTLMEIFNDLISKSKELTQEIEKAGETKNQKILTEMGHNLKGMAGNFGLQSLMEHSAQIERAGRDGDVDKAVALSLTIRPVLNQSLAAITKWLES